MKAESIFLDAVELPTPQERAAFVARACGDDSKLGDQVLGLLRSHERAEGFLEESLFATDDPPAGTSEGPGDWIGPYRLVEAVGEGGMGVVYVAEQHDPVHREVALKIVRPGMASKQVVARFEAERQALALMDHPNIAKVFDGGATASGRPFFVMELVRGVAVTDYCEAGRLGIRERLELFVLVCRAVQHAHQKGVIHRDLKPSNILVTLQDGVPVPKVIDFGVAKATRGALAEKTPRTVVLQIVGTPLYMSPEQAELSGVDVDSRGDVYSLGVLLYELLTGTTPFDSDRLKRASFDEMRRIIREEEPPRPGERLSVGSDPKRLRRAFRDELDWIVMKALEKDRRRRFDSAGEFAADVCRYLNDQPVEACPPTVRYRFRKFARRNKAALTTVSLVLVASLVGLAVSARQAVRASRAEERAEARRLLAEANAREAERRGDEARRLKRVVEAREASLRRHLYAADMKLAWQTWSGAWNKDDLDQVRRLLDRHEPAAGLEDVRGFAWFHLKALCGQSPRSTLVGHEGKVYHLAVSPDGATVATAGQDGTARLWDPAAKQLRHTLRGHVGEVNCVEFAPDGKEIVTAGDDRTVRFWDPVSGREHVSRALVGFAMPVHRVFYSADGASIVTGEVVEEAEAATTIVWDVSSRKPRVRLEGRFPLALSPDSKSLATTGRDKVVAIRDLVAGRDRAVLRGHVGTLLAGAFSPDGESVATASFDGTVNVWDANGLRRSLRRGPGSRTGMENSLRGAVHCVAFAPNGGLVAAGDDFGAICVWDPSDGRLNTIFGGHEKRVRSLRFTPDGGTLASVGDDEVVRLWDMTAAFASLHPPDQPEPYNALGFSVDGGTLATSMGTKRSLLRNVRTGEAGAPKLDRADRDATCATFSPVENLIAVVGSDQSLSLVDPDTGESRWSHAGAGASIRTLTFSPNGEFLVGGGDDRVVRVWDATTGNAVHARTHAHYAPLPQALAISPDGGTLAVGALTAVQLTDLATGAPRALWTTGLDGVDCLAYSPDGRTLAIGVGDRRHVQLWDTRAGRERVALKGGDRPILSLAFSPDGRTLAAGDDRGDLKLWDVATERELVSLVGHGGPVHFAAFSPDGRTLATAGASADGRRGELRFWLAPVLREPSVRSHP